MSKEKKITGAITDIMLGHVNEMLGINHKIASPRLLICYECPLYSYRLGGVCNNRLWLNPETNEVSIKQKEGFVRGCNCRLEAKTTLPNAHCPAGKW